MLKMFKFFELAKPKKIKVIEICGYIFGEGSEIEIVYYNNKPCILLEEENDLYVVLNLDKNYEVDYLNISEFKRVEEYIKVDDIIEMLEN